MKLTAARKQGLDVLAHAVDPVRPGDATSAPGASPHPTVKFETAEWLIQEGLARIENEILTATDEGRTLAGVPSSNGASSAKSTHQARQDEINRQAVDGIEVDRPKEILTVPIDKVRPASDNIRPVVTDDDEFRGLVASIRTLGILEPLLVTTADDGFEVFAGSRRLAAAHEAGRSEIPVIVHQLDALGRLERMIVENLQRKGLSPLEEANAFAKAKELGMKQKDIAARSGISEGQVSKRLALLKLPQKALDAVSSGKIPVTAAEELTKLSSDPKRLEKALKAAESMGGSNIGDHVDWAVKRQLAELEREKARNAIIEELEKKGLAVIPHPGPYSWHNEEQRPLEGQPVHDFPKLPITVEEHAGEPCHGVAVESDGDVVYVCLDPKRHTVSDDGKPAFVDPESPSLFNEEKEIAEAEAARERWEEVCALRWDFIISLLSSLPPKADVTEYLLVRQVFSDNDTYFDSGDFDDLLVGLGLATIDNVEELDGWEELQKYAVTSGDALAKAGFGLALIGTELGLKWQGSWTGNEMAHRHFALLTGRGYQLAPEESERLGLEPGQKPGTSEG